MNGSSSNHRGHRSSLGQSGFTLIELLIVMAIVGVMAGVVVMSGRPIARGQDALAAVKTMQQSVWQGATMAASRGVRTRLELNGRFLDVVREDNNERVRRFELPATASLNTANDPLLVFTPPGKVDTASLNLLPNNLTLTVDGKSYSLEISLIGEVRATGL
ncbi:MAG: prepilin-type N-terminal cleavage/methylation domain-containing protein [Trueperaceae bacterium]|nr:prepilin-type N-terminal cleavage/methylation domain-containing protein [Trueperaceae bacterium]